MWTYIGVVDHYKNPAGKTMVVCEFQKGSQRVSKHFKFSDTPRSEEILFAAERACKIMNEDDAKPAPLQEVLAERALAVLKPRVWHVWWVKLKSLFCRRK